MKTIHGKQEAEASTNRRSKIATQLLHWREVSQMTKRHNVSPSRRRSRTSARRLTTALTAVIVALTVALIASAGTANATTSGCKDGRCWVLLSRAETKEFGDVSGWAPPAPAGMNPVLTASYWALVKTHSVIAHEYAKRGLCSAFLLSMYPWENQGYISRKC